MPKPCKYGHVAGRDKSGNCKECGRLRYHADARYRAAQKTRAAARREENPAAENARYRKYRNAKKAALVAYKDGRCKDCGGKFPDVCYDFHHRKPFEKSFAISLGIGKPLAELKREADKCDLLCRNCHAVRTSGDPEVSRKLSLGQSRRKRIGSEEGL